MNACRQGDRDLGVAFQTHPGRQAFISSGSKEARSALEGGQQKPRSLRAMKAPCTAGSGQGVVTENGKCKSISCCYEENEEVVGKSRNWKVPRQQGFNG